MTGDLNPTTAGTKAAQVASIVLSRFDLHIQPAHHLRISDPFARVIGSGMCNCANCASWSNSSRINKLVKYKPVQGEHVFCGNCHFYTKPEQEVAGNSVTESSQPKYTCTQCGCTLQMDAATHARVRGQLSSSKRAVRKPDGILLMNSVQNGGAYANLSTRSHGKASGVSCIVESSRCVNSGEPLLDMDFPEF